MTVTMEALAREIHYAREDARKSRDTAMEAHENTGKCLREVSALRGDVTRSFGNLHGRLDEVLGELRALRRDYTSIRPKVDSYSELEPALKEETASHHLAKLRRRQLQKWGRRAVLAFVVGAAGVAGAAATATLLQKCSHGRVVVPSSPESP